MHTCTVASLHITGAWEDRMSQQVWSAAADPEDTCRITLSTSDSRRSRTQGRGTRDDFTAGCGERVSLPEQQGQAVKSRASHSQKVPAVFRVPLLPSDNLTEKTPWRGPVAYLGNSRSSRAVTGDIPSHKIYQLPFCCLDKKCSEASS